MTALSTETVDIILANPLDLIEQIVAANEWTYERDGDDEISIAIAGSWCEYHLRFYWREGDNALQVACAYDMKVPSQKRKAIYETLAIINERMWMGHLEVWAEEGALMFRHSAFIDNDGSGLSVAHAEMLIELAINECERFYPVFQFVIWAGKSPEEAIQCAMLETMGEA
ncbi:MAG: YbjN domain-containing protein [Pseudomonadota bacterium]